MTVENITWVYILWQSKSNCSEANSFCRIVLLEGDSTCYISRGRFQLELLFLRHYKPLEGQQLQLWRPSTKDKGSPLGIILIFNNWDVLSHM